MKETVFKIGNIPVILYGEEGERAYLFVHGKCGNKEEARTFAEISCPRGWQVLSMDLPEHGSRKAETGTFDPWHIVPELQTVMDFTKRRWKKIGLRATSIGAWFSMLAFETESLEKSLFVSPILDMEHLIHTMMQWAGVTEAALREEKNIQTDFGETLSWQYYQYAREHPICSWSCPTAILYAGGDNMTPRQEVERFSARFRCDLEVLEDGEHWFHTERQLEILRRWSESHI